MGIISRFKSIMESNINAALDKAEDPEKMIDQTMRDLMKNLETVKKETAGVIAEEKRCKRAVDACLDEIKEDVVYAKRAVAAGNDDDARKFLEEKARDEAKLVPLQEAYNLAHTNAEQMITMHDKLVADIAELNTRKEMVRSKMAVAKTQQVINTATGAAANAANGSIAAFERMEAKANKALDEAQAIADLHKNTGDTLVDLKSKYNVSTDEVEDELAKLKASLNE